MNSVLTLERTKKSPQVEHPFLQELIEQIRLADRFKKYSDWSDEILLKQFIKPKKNTSQLTQNFNLDALNQVLVNAFYNAIAVVIKRKTGHNTDTFVHMRNKEFSSAVISCGGVFVLYSLIWGYRSFDFVSIQELIEAAENYITHAVNKASCYLELTTNY